MECGLAEQLHFTAFPVKLEHWTLDAYQNYAWALNIKGWLPALTQHYSSSGQTTVVKNTCKLLFNSWYCIRQSQNAKLGFDWHFLKNMQQIWDVIWMAASVLNVKYLDIPFWTLNSFFDNDFCKDWYYISFLIMYIVCH